MSLLCASGVFSTILYVILAIIILLFMVLIHEFGHYVVGRLLKFKITEFSIGFGKAIWQKTNKRGELISLRIFPLGGYCAFAGEEGDEEENSDKKENNNTGKTTEITSDTKQVEEKQEKLIELDKNFEPKKGEDLLFNEQKPWKRLLVYGAGVFFNFLSAIVFSFILLVSFGYDIQQVERIDSKSVNYGVLQEGDVIWKVNGEKVSFAFSGTLNTLITQSFSGDTTNETKDFTLTIKRDGKELDVNIKVSKEKDEESGEIKYHYGFATKAYAHSFLEALGRCFELAFGFGWVVLKGFWQIISGQIAFSELGGPISTVGMITTIAKSSFVNVFILMPLLAANLAVFNFLPIPALDGSHAVFILLEWIFGKPVVSRKTEGYIHFYGLMALLLLVVVADIVHIAIKGF